MTGCGSVTESVYIYLLGGSHHMQVGFKWAFFFFFLFFPFNNFKTVDYNSDTELLQYMHGDGIDFTLLRHFL